jgi:hypothetical protein
MQRSYGECPPGKFGTAIPTFEWFAGLSQNQTPCQSLNNIISQNVLFHINIPPPLPEIHGGFAC